MASRVSSSKPGSSSAIGWNSHSAAEGTLTAAAAAAEAADEAEVAAAASWVGRYGFPKQQVCNRKTTITWRRFRVQVQCLSVILTPDITSCHKMLINVVIGCMRTILVIATFDCVQLDS